MDAWDPDPRLHHDGIYPFGVTSLPGVSGTPRSSVWWAHSAG